MKILHVFDHSIPLHSGYTFRSRSILLQQRALGWETCHVTSPKQGHFDDDVETIDGLTFYRTKVPTGLATKLPGFNQLALVNPLKQRILEAIEIEKPDIIHAHSPALNGLAALRASRATGIPVVYEIRAFWEDAAVDHGTCKEGDIRYRLTRKMESYVVEKADAVTTICEGLKSDLLNRGVDKNKITTIPNAVNVDQFDMITQRDSELQAQFDLDGKSVIGFLGSFYGYEGIDLIVEAMPAMLAKRHDLVFLLVGGGPQEANIKAQIKKLGLEGNVIMPGRVPHSDVAKYYSLVDLLVYPRKPMRLTDLVTPLKPLEAMAQGKLVLASDVGGHKELIEDGKTGWLFNAGDLKSLAAKTLSILDNAEQWPDVTSQGRDFVESVRNWKNSVSQYQLVYPALIRAKRAK